jgi:hypothetical protein
LMGRQGHRGLGQPCVVKRGAFGFGLLRVLSGDSLVVLRGPLGLSPTEADEANHVPTGGLGAWSLAGGTIHSAGRPSSFAASWPAATSWFSGNRVTVERSHANGSMMTRGGWGAMREDEEARDDKQEGGEELRRRKAAWARTARGWGARSKNGER